MPWGRGALFIIYSSHLSNLIIRPLQTPGPLETEEPRRFNLNEGPLIPNRIPSRTPPLSHVVPFERTLMTSAPSLSENSP